MNVSENHERKWKSSSENLVRDQLIDQLVFKSAVIGCIGFGMTQIRAWQIGWSSRDLIFALILISLVSVALCRHRLTTSFKTNFLILSYLPVGVVGFYAFGIFSGGAFFIVLSAVILALFYSARTVAIYVLLLIAYMAAIALGFGSGNIKLNARADFLITSYAHWAVYIVSILFFFLLTCPTILKYRRIFVQLIDEVSRQRQELNQMNQELREKEEKYRCLSEASFEGVAFTKDGVILEANKTMPKMFGLDAQEIIGKSAVDFVEPGYREDVRHKILSGYENVYNTVCLKKDGSSFPAEIQGRMFTYNGKPVRVTAIRNLTETAKMHEALRKSEEKFKSLVEITSDWIWEVDSNGNYTYCSPKVQDLLGYEPNEMIGKKPFDFMPEQEAQRVADLFAKISAARKPFDCMENINLHKDGREVVLETSGVPLFDKNGKMTGYRGMDRDITESKRIEESLRESEQRFRMLSAASPTAIAIRRGRQLFYVNSAWEDLTGYSEKEALSMDACSFFHPEVKDEVFQRGEARLRGEHIPTPFEMKIVTKGGQVKWIECNATVVKFNDSPALLSVAVDVTARRQYNQERDKLIKELQKALNEIDTLRGILPLCSFCKKIRNDSGYWEQVDVYIHKHSKADISHSVCPECAQKHYPDWLK